MVGSRSLFSTPTPFSRAYMPPKSVPLVTMAMAIVEPVPARAQGGPEYYRATIAAAEGAIAAGDAGLAAEWLDAAPERYRGWEWGFLHRTADGSERTIVLDGASLWAVAISPDGKRVATGTDRGTIHLFPMTAGVDSAVLRHGEGQIYDLTFSPDGRELLSAGSDRFIRIWDLATARLRDSIPTAPRRPLELAFNREGSLLAASLSEGGVATWEYPSRHPAQSFLGHVPQPPVPGVTFLPDGRLASGSWDQHIRVWAASGDSIRTLGPGYGTDARYSAWSDVEADPQGRYLAGVGRDGLHLWNLADWKERSFHEHTTDVPALAVGRNGDLIVTGSADRTLRLWDPSTGKVLAVWLGHTGAVRSVDFSADGKTVVSSGDDGTVRVWDVDKALASVALLADGAPYVVKWSPDGRQLAIANHAGVIRIWDPATGRPIREFKASDEPIVVLDFSPDWRRVLVGSNRAGPLGVWDVESGTPLLLLADTAIAVSDAVFSPDGGRIITAGRNGRLRVWDARTGREMAEVGRDSSSKAVPSRLQWSQDGRTLLVGWDDGAIGVIEPEHWALRGRWSLGAGGITALLRVPGKSDFVIGTSTGSLIVWDSRSGKALRRWKGHAERIYGAAFDPAGRRLITTAADGTAKLWRPNQWALLTTIRNFGELGPYCAAFSPDGLTVVVGGLDRTIRFLRGGVLATEREPR